MTKFNPKNERIKKAYYTYLKEADQKAETTIDGIRKAISRFESYTGFKDFGTFNKGQAIGFKKHLANMKAERTKMPIANATMLSTINPLKAFFKWLSLQSGYKRLIDLNHIEYLNLSAKEEREAKEVAFKDFSSLEQIHKVIFSMPHESDIEKRDRALIAFTILTGLRVGAIASLQLKHIDLENELVKQDPREVKTKFSKRIDTYFFPVGDDIKAVFVDWVKYLKEQMLFSPCDPVFPQTNVIHDENKSFMPHGLKADFWQSGTPICKIFKEAFESADLKYFNPHSFRNTLVDLAYKYCKTPEEFKAWSQNLGHESPITTFTSYGTINPHRQGAILKKLLSDVGANDIESIIRDAIRKEIKGV